MLQSVLQLQQITSSSDECAGGKLVDNGANPSLHSTLSLLFCCFVKTNFGVKKTFL